MKGIGFLFCLSIFILQTAPAMSADAPLSGATSECIDCHASVHPGIVKDWQNSRHAQITPGIALAVEGLARKVSVKSVPENLRNTAVGCAECHLLRPQKHADTFEHNGYDIHVVVSPEDCSTCHVQEAEQYSKNIMAHAYDNLAENALYQKLQRSIIGTTKRKGEKITFGPADEATKAEACYYCHGTKLKVTGSETRDTEAAGELEFPVIEGWPNQGVGRVNLDGSLGSCSACHTRHAFSIEMARKPYTCKECHIGPDVPAFKVYAASKHGNIFSALGKNWNFKAVPWTIGKDFTAPTCASCHVSLLVNTDEEVVVERTHMMNNRLPWRIFGLIYAHPHPQNPDTTIIRNKNGRPLPTSLDGEFAAEYLIDAKERNTRRQSMQAACLNCHDASWVNGHWRRFENTIKQTNADILLATNIMGDVWQQKLADFKSNPFDEAVEKKWTDTWQFYANTIRFASAMGGGGDYGVYADGRYQLSQALLELNDWFQLRKK
ncbi:MAG: hydroxylamine oxidase [Desulfobacterales bacterium]|nr:hydroxylamine oxidase [Desulfobacterales bacterium]